MHIHYIQERNTQGLRAISSTEKCKFIIEPWKIKKEPLKIPIDCKVKAYSMLHITKCSGM